MTHNAPCFGLNALDSTHGVTTYSLCRASLLFREFPYQAKLSRAHSLWKGGIYEHVRYRFLVHVMVGVTGRCTARAKLFSQRRVIASATL